MTRSSTWRTSRGGCGNRAAAAAGGDIGDVVVRASLEVRGSVVYATFVVALVFLPVLALTGVQGALFRPLALAYIFATLAVAHRGADGDAGALARAAHPAQHPRARIGRAAATSSAATRRLLSALFKEPVRGLRRDGRRCASAPSPRCRSSAPRSCRSSARDTTSSTCRRCPARRWRNRCGSAGSSPPGCSTDPRVRLVAQRAGRAELSEDTWGTHYTEFEVDLVPLTGRDAETVQDDLRRMLEGIPGRQLRDPRLPGRAHRGDADRLDGAGGGEALRRRPRQPRHLGAAHGRDDRPGARCHGRAVRSAAGGAGGHGAAPARSTWRVSACVPTRRSRRWRRRHAGRRWHRCSTAAAPRTWW